MLTATLLFVALAAAPILGQPPLLPRQGLLPNPSAGAEILHKSSENVGNGNFRWEFETSDGTTQQQVGFLKPADPYNEEGIQAVMGSYSYISPEGIQITVNYIADENGFQPIGDHIPGNNVRRSFPTAAPGVAPERLGVDPFGRPRPAAALPARLGGVDAFGRPLPAVPERLGVDAFGRPLPAVPERLGGVDAFGRPLPALPERLGVDDFGRRRPAFVDPSRVRGPLAPVSAVPTEEELLLNRRVNGLGLPLNNPYASPYVNRRFPNNAYAGQSQLLGQAAYNRGLPFAPAL